MTAKALAQELPPSAAIQSTPSTQHRFHFLDALRGLVAALVVFWHAPGYAKLPVEQNGFLAVDFFFCLSGFVVAFAYESRLQTSLRFKDFAVARLIRLYPVYLAALLLGLCITVLYVHKFHEFGFLRGCVLPLFFFQLFMLPAAVTAGRPWLFPFDFPAWSIFFELIANFAYGALVRMRWARTRHLAVLFLGTALALAIWVGQGENLDQGATHSGSSIVIGLVRVFLSFIAGVLTLRLLRRYKLAQWTGATSTVIAMALAAILVLLLLAPPPLPGSGQFKVFIIAVLFPGIVYLGALCTLPSVLTSTCSLLGDLSYPVYLFHLHFLRLLALPSVEAMALRHPALRLSWVSATLVLCSLVCFALLRLYDQPTRSFLQRRYKNLAFQKLSVSHR